MKVLVAGGAGFIGSHLVDALLKAGDSVVVVDNYFIGTKTNLHHIASSPNYKFFEQDLCDINALDGIFGQERFDYVYHLAANSDIRASAADTEIEYKNTYTTTYNLLECMRRYGVKKLFFASTSAVYGEKFGDEVGENSTPLNPISYYGAAKLGSEALISAFSFMNDFSALVFRFPNVIGPRLTHGVIFDFIKKLRKNPAELEVLGDGKQAKPYIYVDDLVNCIMLLKDSVKSGVEVYNVGVETQTTVTDIAHIVRRAMGLEGAEIKYTGGRGGWKGDVPIFAYDLSKIHAAGWLPKLESTAAVEATVAEVLKCKR